MLFYCGVVKLSLALLSGYNCSGLKAYFWWLIKKARDFFELTIFDDSGLLGVGHDGAVPHRLLVLALVHHALPDVLLRVEQHDVQFRREQAHDGHRRTQAEETRQNVSVRLFV